MTELNNLKEYELKELVNCTDFVPEDTYKSVEIVCYYTDRKLTFGFGHVQDFNYRLDFIKGEMLDD